MSETTWVPTSWLPLINVHPENQRCRDYGCTIHNQTDHKMKHWQLHWRNDRGIFERICAHGIGHPDPDQFPFWKRQDRMSEAVHGCDGCCQRIEVQSV